MITWKKTVRRMALLIAFAILLSGFELAAYAREMLNGRATTINEYDYLLNMKERSDSELFDEGYTSEDINSIRHLEDAYSNHLRQFMVLDDAALSNLGYSNEQIMILRSFNGSEEQIRALAATLFFDLYIDFVTWSQADNRTNARLCYDFSWNGVPLIKTRDIVAVSWNDWTINGTLSYITYVSITGTGSNLYLPATYVPNNGPTSFGGGFKFAMTQNDNYYWAKSGYGIFTLYKNYIRHDLSAYAEYGHSTVLLNPGFSIPGYGSISFTYGIDMKAQDWADMNCQN
ncbi:MAG: hypothetical protein IJK77_09630 [Lachnospiraceae bacterium]|nr:hypothetical protein [Lachnospiraceae bacterium]